MDEHSAALHHRVVDHKLVIEGSFFAIDGLWVELDLPRLGVKLWRPANATAKSIIKILHMHQHI